MNGGAFNYVNQFYNLNVLRFCTFFLRIMVGFLITDCANEEKTLKISRWKCSKLQLLTSPPLHHSQVSIWLTEDWAQSWSELVFPKIEFFFFNPSVNEVGWCLWTWLSHATDGDETRPEAEEGIAKSTDPGRQKLYMSSLFFSSQWRESHIGTGVCELQRWEQERELFNGVEWDHIPTVIWGANGACQLFEIEVSAATNPIGLLP